MRSVRKVEVQDFPCSLLGDTATVSLTVLRLEGTATRDVVGGKCDRCRDCGVGHSSDGGMSYGFDWHKCVHPELHAN